MFLGPHNFSALYYEHLHVHMYMINIEKGSTYFSEAFPKSK